MYKISNSEALDLWEDNQAERLTGEGFVELEYMISDPYISAANPKVAGNNPHELSDMPDTVNPPIIDRIERNVAPYATLEPELWKLDKSRVTVPEPRLPYSTEYPDRLYSGYISYELCDISGEFNPRPLITITFEKAVKANIKGMTILWSEVLSEYPVDFEIRLYETLTTDVTMLTKTSDDADVEKGETTVVPLGVSEFQKVEIEIKKWCRGNRRARVGKITMGVEKIYNKESLLNFSCTESFDPVSGSLPKYEISFEIDNRNGDFDPKNPDSLTKFMMEQQEIRTRYGFKLKGFEKPYFIQGGVYYLSDWIIPQNGLSATFKARDLLGFLDAPFHKGRFYGESKSINLLKLAEEVLEEANIPAHRKNGIPWVLDKKALESVETTAPLPICSLAECLQLIANAACCSIFFDMDGKINIMPLEDKGACGLEINPENSYSNPEISLTRPVKQIDVSQYSYIRDTGASANLYKGEIDFVKDVPVVIEYSELADVPENGVVIHGVTNAEIERYARCCIITVNRSVTCNVTITGTTYRTAEQIVTIKNENVELGETQRLQNPLITDNEVAHDVGKWLKIYVNRRNHVSSDWRIDPRLDVGDIVEIVTQDKNKTKTRTSARITSNNLSFTGAFKAKSEGVMFDDEHNIQT